MTNWLQVELVDFGATRTYSKKFMDSWLRLLQAAASDDRQKCIDESIKLGYLTGAEDEVGYVGSSTSSHRKTESILQIMLDAHVRSLTLLATPFKESTTQPFSFGPYSTWADVTKEIRSLIPVMVTRRLTPPPKETYSLNRWVVQFYEHSIRFTYTNLLCRSSKLSGAFLLAARLNAEVDTKAIWDQVVGQYEFDSDSADNGGEVVTLTKDID